jgi:hypothetical protein
MYRMGRMAYSAYPWENRRVAGQLGLMYQMRPVKELPGPL